MASLTITMRIALMLLALAACAPDPVGRRCDVGPAPRPDDIVIATDSLDCLSRLCLGTPGAPPMCSAACATDDDCPAEPSSPCHAGFTCAPAVDTGPFRCQRMCVCKDAVDPVVAQVCDQSP